MTWTEPHSVERPVWPAPSTASHVVAWFLKAAVLVAVAVVTLSVLSLAASEDICFDRTPWWGPPDSNSSTDCSGHINQRREAGYGWFGGP